MREMFLFRCPGNVEVAVLIFSEIYIYIYYGLFFPQNWSVLVCFFGKNWSVFGLFFVFFGLLKKLSTLTTPYTCCGQPVWYIWACLCWNLFHKSQEIWTKMVRKKSGKSGNLHPSWQWTPCNVKLKENITGKSGKRGCQICGNPVWIDR